MNSYANMPLAITSGPAELRKPSVQIAETKEAIEEAVVLGRRMLAFMKGQGGIGLAAPQVGVRARLIVINVTGDPKDDLILINPVIIEKSEATSATEEGCLSFPDESFLVIRPREVTVTYAFGWCDMALMPSYPHRSVIKANGLVARAIQHEIDHLDGILIRDKQVTA